MRAVLVVLLVAACHPGESPREPAHPAVAVAVAYTDPDLRRELLALRVEDQAAREAWTNFEDPVQTARVDASDRKTTARMKQLIAAGGWPGKSRVGEDGAHAAWLFVQHATADLAFQKECLALIEAAAHTGEATQVELAYLYDRIAMQESRPQRFGTQFMNGEPYPIEDPEHVDDRRKAIGMPTMADYREELRTEYGAEIK